MKITVIDLLNKIANDEEVPTKIKYPYITWEWNEEQKDYIELNGATRNLFTYYLDNLTDCLNDEIEIIEEPKEELEEIELLKVPRHWYANLLDENDLSLDEKCWNRLNAQEDKINELIENQNNIIKELKAKKQ